MVIISRVSSINPVTCTIYLVPLQKGVYIKEVCLGCLAALSQFGE